MISVNCVTNLDLDRNEKWPSELTARPMVGDIVESSHIWTLENGGCCSLALKVVGITWRSSSSNWWYLDVELELHLPSNFKNIAEFELWYQKTRRKITLDEYRARYQELPAQQVESKVAAMFSRALDSLKE